MASVPTATKARSLTFCVTGKSGLGHLRRTANIASAVKRLSPDVDLRLVANAPVDGLSEDERNIFAETSIVERADMARCVAQFADGPVVSDTAVIPDLELLPRRLVLILRETIEARLAAFRMPGGRLWDETLVAAPRGQWTVDPTVIGAALVENVGWIYRAPERGAERVLPARCGDERRILVATGGGGTPATAAAFNAELDAVLERALRLCARQPRILQVLGPRAPKHARLARAHEIVDVGSRLDAAFGEADLVISTAGYNSVLELAVADTPTLLMSIPRTFDDQGARAVAWASGLGLAHRPGELDRSARWIAQTVETGQRRAPISLGECGSRRAAERVLAHVGLPLAERATFSKQQRADSMNATCSIQKRSGALFVRGVRTPPAAVHSPSDKTVFARIVGPTALQAWKASAECRRGSDGENRNQLLEHVVVALAALHRTPREGIDVPWFDPWLRVRPRLEPGSAAGHALGSSLVTAALAVAGRLSAVDLGAPRRWGLVHGDFHLGQLIRPRGRDDFVIVDLDDLALGSPEADVANCAAHLATSTGLHGGAVGGSMRELLTRLVNAYEAATGIPLQWARIAFHASLALLRRALKLAERGIRAEAAENIIVAAMTFSLIAQYDDTAASHRRTDNISTPVQDPMGVQS